MTEQNTEFNFETLAPVFEENKELLGTVLNTYAGDDYVKEYLEAPEKAGLIQSRIDSEVSKGVDAFKRNKLDSLIETEIAKRYPAESPEQIELRKTTERIARLEQEKNAAVLQNYANRLASERDLPTSLIDFLVGEDEVQTRNRINQFELNYNSEIERSVEKRLKSTSKKTKPAGVVTDKSGKELDPMLMDAKQRNELFKNNPDQFHLLFG